ncbi:synapse-associated protein 1 isoform X2 [Ailuropoda melanoleuca]|uniref:synapse-associated protein 1 isoform X2 n=1 Tax=Ailuropoda melanoleuca TaxID=9646 RepID=UPI001494F7DB|nr:synapse-associated protein 1 isoform X2 [Ailuropoda melanoleuca]
MFRSLSSWFGLEQPAAAGRQSEGDGQVEGDASPQQCSEAVSESAAEGEPRQAGDQDLLHQAKGLGNYLFSFATAATKKITESVAETAQTIKKSVEEGKIDDIIDKTIIGDFQKEQKKFVEEQHTKKSEAAVPPWVDSNDEEIIQQQILALSADKRNFLRDPPAGVQFNFDFDQMYPVALVMLQEDELLSRMRFALVPKLVKEEVFWRNYFYRVSLIKQSAQLTALAAQQQASGKEEKNHGVEEDLPLTEAVRPKTPPVVIKSQLKTQEDEEEISTSPGVSEFVSDAFDACNLNQEDLRKEMEQLVLDKKEEESAVLEDSADWEKELQQELQEYEVVTESEKRDENWDKEIEKMLQEEN